jgi:hypothetical protein
MRKASNLIGLFSISSVFLYAVFFTLSRKLFTENILVYSALFALFYGTFLVYKTTNSKSIPFFEKLSIKRWKCSGAMLVLFAIGIIFRLTLISETPNLSQDFFRFIWDGHQLLNGFNPYIYLPDEVVAMDASHIPNANFLHENMGALSSGHYSNYPPLNQLFFAAAAYLGGDSLLGSVVWMRVFIILADVGIFIYGVRLLSLLGKPPYLILLYYLNPFVIIELTGNLHWEGVMAFLMLVSVYFLFKRETVKSALFIGNAILLKLMPVLVLPLVLKRLKWRKWFVFYGFVSFVVVLGFLPFLSMDLFEKYGATVGLWFGSFEFNASIYYIIRAVGYEVTGYNIIGTAGKILPIVTFIIVWLLALLRKNELPEVFLSSIVFAFFTYYMLSTTVHPWYLTIPLLFSVFIKYRFIVVWSFTVFLSYYAYGNDDFKESLVLVAVEYLVVVGWFVYEVFVGPRKFKSRI